MKYTVDADHKPPPNQFYGDTWERGLDPWHVDASPSEFKDAMVWNRGDRKSGWFLNDAWGNQISFIVDGTEIETPNA